MYFSVPAQKLSPRSREELDDNFFSTDQFGYFCARIEMLLHWHEHSDNTNVDGHTGGPARTRLQRLLQRDTAFVPGYSNRVIEMQVATDAYALRHHVAESLVRLAAVVLQHDPEYEEVCIWQEISTGPGQIHQVKDQIQKSFENEDEAALKFASRVVHRESLATGLKGQTASASNVFADWLDYALLLLTRSDINLNGAYNKIKHGLSAHTRNDLRIALSNTAPAEDGNIPLSALKGPNAIDVIDRPAIEFLSSAPKEPGKPQGLEFTVLRVDIPELLADTYMMAWTHAAMFSVRARQHFSRRPETAARKSTQHPGYPVGGPSPKHFNEKQPLGMRFPLTDPAGDSSARQPGVAFRDGFLPLIQSDGSGRKGRVVND